MTLLEQAQQLETAAHVLDGLRARLQDPHETISGMLSLTELDALETGIKTLYSRALNLRELEGRTTSC